MEVNARNTETIRQKLVEQDKMIREQQEKINGLNNKIQEFLDRLGVVEEYIMKLRIKEMGTGSTVM